MANGDGTLQLSSAPSVPPPRQVHCLTLVRPEAPVVDQGGQLTQTVSVWFALNTPDTDALYMAIGHGGRYTQGQSLPLSYVEAGPV